MGSVIREDTEGEPSAVLTETGKGGLFSEGYLKDAPAREYVGQGETAVFVLTDDETGVERTKDGETTTIPPGSGYRAITVVTDRRIIVLVGNAEDGGDRRVTLPLVETAMARTQDGTLVIEMSSGISWRCHADTDGVEAVAEYVQAAAETWRNVEATLDDVKRRIVTATARRDDGEYDAALEAIRDARDEVAAIEEHVTEFDAKWPGTALVGRVEQVRDRCLTTAAEIRVGYARATIDEGEEHWRAGEYERARDAFEDARDAFETVQALPPRYRREIDVDTARERLERSIERLDHAPLRNAIDADRRAGEIEPGPEALDALAEARNRYDDVLSLHRDAEQQWFAGDRGRIRKQREDVTDRFVETVLTVGTNALEAAEWYSETDQPALAVEALERGITALERGLSVADTERPGVVDEIHTNLSKAKGRIAEIRERRDSVAGTDADSPDDRTGVDDDTEWRADGGDSDRGADESEGSTDPGDSEADAPSRELGSPIDATATDGGLSTTSAGRESSEGEPSTPRPER